MEQKVNVLIVDDSQLVRGILKEIFENDPELRVAGEAGDGKEAIEAARRLKPDIITMDIQMPVMDGFEATEHIMAYTPTPILILSSALDECEQYSSFKAISLGALDTMSKPDITQEGFDRIARDLVRKVKMLSHIHVIPHIRAKLKDVVPMPTRKKSFDDLKYRLVAIGASTGGPMALEQLFSVFPADFPLGIVAVQHISAGFIQSFVDWMDTKTKLKINIPGNGEPISGGTVYFAPDGVQMEVSADNSIILNKDLPPWGEFKPSVNHLFKSVGQRLGGKAIGVILTGMGDDGARGMVEMYRNGGHTIAQDQATSLIYGMPKAAAANKCVHSVLPLEKIPDEIFKKIEE
ncbi:MAG: chemotaxis-specific protein-glutamate methyltransferase CheB [bacterium]|nr:chemotaxis-specific protein-glutamate methyltransferase CheB [bacterium]